jgi:hypothetical protein
MNLKKGFEEMQSCLVHKKTFGFSERVEMVEWLSDYQLVKRNSGIWTGKCAIREVQ